MSDKTTVPVAQPAGGAPPPSRVSDGVGGGGRRLGSLASRFSMLGVLVVLIIVATFLYPAFLNPANIGNILTQNSAIGLIAIGMTFVIICGGFDLSVGATYALGATLYAGLTLQTGSVLVAGLLTLAAGIVVGVVNGLIISRLNINPFVATLGTASIISGVAYVYSNSSPFIVNNVPQFQDLALSTIAGIPQPIWILVIAFVLAAILLSKTTFGRNVYAVGGTSLLGDEGAIWRSAVGLLILATLTNVFYSLNVSQNWQLIAKGTIVVAAVGVDAIIRVRKRG